MCLGVTVKAAIAVIALCTCGAVHAQSSAEYSAWLKWCREQGGIPNNDPNHPVCTPASQGGGSSGWTSAEQGMLGLAGAIGSALGNAIRESFEAAERRAAIQRMQQAWELERARTFAVQERERLSREMRERNEALIARLKGRVAASELSMVRVERKELRLRNRDEMFGNKPDVRSLTEEVVVAGAIPATPAPPDLEGRAIRPSGPDEAGQAWDNYLAALQRRNQAEAEMAAAQQRRENSRLIVEAARQKAEEERTRAASAAHPPEIGDDRLAEAERLLAEATALDEKAEQELAKSTADVEAAKKSLEEAQGRVAQSGTAMPQDVP